jgi:hypothetical protein
MASTDDDAKAKSFVVSKDKASIYLYRNESFGAAISMDVALNGRLAGKTAALTYFLWEVDPGTYEVSSVAENTSTVKLNVEAGKAYYVWQEVKMGLWMARSQLQQVDDATGRKGVSECKRVLSSF